jgi:hypothetical protein
MTRWILLSALLLQDKIPLKLQLKPGLFKFEQTSKVAWKFEKIDDASRKALEATYQGKFKNFKLADLQVMDLETVRSGEAKIDGVHEGLAQAIYKVDRVRLKGRYYGTALDHTLDDPKKKVQGEFDEGVADLLEEARRYLGRELRVPFDALGRRQGKEPHFVFGALPEQPMARGEKWEHSSSSTLDPLGVEVEIRAASTLAGSDRDLAVIQTALTVAPKGKLSEEPKIAVEGSGTGQAEIDLRNGRIVSAGTRYEIAVTVAGTDPDTKNPIDMKMIYTFEQAERFTYGD